MEIEFIIRIIPQFQFENFSRIKPVQYSTVVRITPKITTFTGKGHAFSKELIRIISRAPKP